MATYHYKRNRQVPQHDPQAVGEELERIRQEAGDLTGEAVVRASKDPERLLHRDVDWHVSDKKCAHAWRVHKARNLINVIVVEEQVSTRDPVIELPAYVNVVEGQIGSEDERRSYLPIRDVLADSVLRGNYVQRCFEKLLRVQREFRHLKEFAAVWTAIDEVGISQGDEQDRPD